MHYRKAKGPTFARSLCESLWDGEEYYLMTDSHIRFEPGWDIEIIEMLLKTKRPRRTIITMYPEGFDRYQNKKNGTLKYTVPIRRGWRYEQLKYFNSQGIVEFESVTTYLPIPKTPKYVPMVGACFVFAHSDILKIVPYHPDTPYLFFGEEMFYTVRLLSHGYDIMGPTHSVVYHLWKRDYRKTFWDHEITQERDRSIQKIKDIMTGKIKDLKYGMGNIRSWKEIQEYLGIDFNKRIFTRSNKPWKLPKNFREIKDKFCVR